MITSSYNITIRYYTLMVGYSWGNIIRQIAITIKNIKYPAYTSLPTPINPNICPKQYITKTEKNNAVFGPTFILLCVYIKYL